MHGPRRASGSQNLTFFLLRICLPESSLDVAAGLRDPEVPWMVKGFPVPGASILDEDSAESIPKIDASCILGQPRSSSRTFEIGGNSTRRDV